MILTLPFLGARQYLQGTTLLDALIVHANHPSKFSFKIEKPIHSNTVEVSKNSDGHSAVLSFDNKSLFVTERPLALPVSRESFDEQALVSHLEKQGNRFVLPMDGISPVRGTVMAFKHTLLKYCPVPQCPGHWAFICMEAVRFPQNTTCSCLTLEKVFCRDRMAFCSVLFDEITVATCYFYWANF